MFKKQPVFLTDVDEVLADFVTPVIKLISEILGRPWSLSERAPGKWGMFEGLAEEQTRKARESLNDYEWVWSLKPKSGTQEAIKELRKISNVYVVTSGMSWAPVRIKWLRKHYEFDKDHLIFTKAKHLVKGDFFIDDSPDYVRKWQRCNPQGQGMMWCAPNNTRLVEENRDIVVPDWETIIKRVREWRPAA